MEDKLDLNSDFVSVGAFTIQECFFFGLPEEVEAEGHGLAKFWRGPMKYIAATLELLYDESRSGTQSGYGHGRETLRLLNRDGSLIFEMSHINHCDGPGYSCSYSHGPWYSYGEYHGDAEMDPDLHQALEIKERLTEKFRF